MTAQHLTLALLKSPRIEPALQRFVLRYRLRAQEPGRSASEATICTRPGFYVVAAKLEYECVPNGRSVADEQLLIPACSASTSAASVSCIGSSARRALIAQVARRKSPPLFDRTASRASISFNDPYCASLCLSITLTAGEWRRPGMRRHAVDLLSLLFPFHDRRPSTPTRASSSLTAPTLVHTLIAHHGRRLVHRSRECPCAQEGLQRRP